MRSQATRRSPDSTGSTNTTGTDATRATSATSTGRTGGTADNGAGGKAGTGAGEATGTVGTRDRIVRVAAQLLQRQGYEGTGIKQISREADATLGSVYHFFPGGKQDLAAEAIRYSDAEFCDALRAGLDSRRDPADAVATFARLLGQALRESGWVDGCPITATALETLDGTADGIQRACDAALHHWQDVVYDKLRAAGIATGDARDLAMTVINTLDGAEVAAQLAHSERPLRVAGTHLARLIRSYTAPDGKG